MASKPSAAARIQRLIAAAVTVRSPTMTDMKATMGETAVPSQSATPRHGGDLTALKAMPGAFAGNWLDLSTGINPLPWPVPAVAPDAWQRRPEPAPHHAPPAAAARSY